MRFEIQSTSSVNSRLGLITELGEYADIHTPMAMSFTRRGLFTYVSKDIFKEIKCISKVAQIPLNSVYANSDKIASFKGGINEFAAIQEFISYVSVHDTVVKCASGFNTTSSVAVWSHNGKINVTVHSYMKVIESLRPSWFQALADSDTTSRTLNEQGQVESQVTRKRLRKSVERSLHFLDLCIEHKKNSPKLSRSEVFGVIEGGWRQQDRIFSAKETRKRDVAGFIIEGLHDFGDDTAFSVDQVYNLMCQIMCELPELKPRLLPGSYGPTDIILAVETGVDIFDSSYTHRATSEGHALLMDYSPDSSQPCDYLDLHDKVYLNDKSSLDDSCDCFTCKSHSRAYCHHLVATKELLAGILLMMLVEIALGHNTHQYQLFFSQIRSSLKSCDILLAATDGDDLINDLREGTRSRSRSNDIGVGAARSGFDALKNRVEKRLKHISMSQLPAEI